MGYKRYAVYFGPRPNEPLHDFGKSWFGTDPETGASLPTSPLPGYSEDTHSTIIKAPRHYALHGTLKPPFVLADGTEYDALKQAVSDLAVTLSSVTLSPLYLKDLSGFLALCPAEPSPSLRIVAGRCVAELDQFRRPASEGEIEKRRAAGLTPDQDANLLRWGYPYVLDDFRFHITLTSRSLGPQNEPHTDSTYPVTGFVHIWGTRRRQPLPHRRAHSFRIAPVDPGRG